MAETVFGPETERTNLSPEEAYEWCRAVLRGESVDPEAEFTLKNIDEIRSIAARDTNFGDTQLQDLLAQLHEEMRLRQEHGLDELNKAIVENPAITLITESEVKELSGFEVDESGIIAPLSNGVRVPLKDIIEINYPSAESEIYE